jgi:hypothetical protein
MKLAKKAEPAALVVMRNYRRARTVSLLIGVQGFTVARTGKERGSAAHCRFVAKMLLKTLKSIGVNAAIRRWVP